MIFALTTILSLLSPSTTHEIHAPKSLDQRYRISALECFQNENWVLVSSFNNGDVFMSWGASESTYQVDLPVRIKSSPTQKKYLGVRDQQEVRLDYTPSEGKLRQGQASLAIKSIDGQNSLLVWPDLLCQLFFED